MDYVENKSLKISRLGIGLSGLGTTFSNKTLINKRKKVLEKALELGVNYIDTAQLYGGGFSESFVGEFSKTYNENLVTMTKFYPRSTALSSIEKQLKESLDRLKSDYIDIWQIHWPNPELDGFKLIENLKKLQKKGYFKFIGVCNYSLRMIREIQDRFPDTISTHQTGLRIHNFEEFINLNNYLKSVGIINLIFNVFSTSYKCIPRLNKYVTSSEFSESKFPINFLNSFGNNSILIKTSKVENLISNYHAAFDKISPKEFKDICKLIQNKRSTSIHPNKILLQRDPKIKNYTNLSSAIKNPDDLIPSPKSLASLISSNDYNEPVKVEKLTNNGKKIYILDSYDLRGEVKKFWAYQIAFGTESQIPIQIT